MNQEQAMISRNRKRLLAALAAACGVATVGAAHGAVVYVKASAVGANNGSSWTNAFTDFNDALGQTRILYIWDQTDIRERLKEIGRASRDHDVTRKGNAAPTAHSGAVNCDDDRDRHVPQAFYQRIEVTF